MKSVLDIISQQPNTQADFKSLKDKLNRKVDVILAAGAKVDSSGENSQLQNCIAEIPDGPSRVFAVAFLLAVQSESLPDSCVKTYIHQCSQLFADAPTAKEHLLVSQKEVLVICQKLVSLSQRAGQPRVVIRMLRQAAVSLAPEPTVLTPIHALLLQVCISGQMYKVAGQFLEANDILEIDLKSTPIQSQDYLEFFYYGGICLIGLRKYAQALDYFMQAITLPAHAVSAVVVASLKAAKLVSLIELGTAFEIPKYASQAVHRFAKQDMPVYDNFVTAFVSNNFQALFEALESGTNGMIEDHFLGLAKLVVESRRMRNIRNLTSTYLTLSLEDIAQSACLQSIEEAEKLILKMVNIGDIKAVVDQQTRMVRFSCMDVSTTRSADKLRENEKALVGLERHIRETLQLSERLRDVQSRLLTSEEYLSKPSGKGLRVGGGIGMGMEIGGMGTMAQDSVGWVVNDSGFSNP